MYTIADTTPSIDGWVRPMEEREMMVLGYDPDDIDYDLTTAAGWRTKITMAMNHAEPESEAHAQAIEHTRTHRVDSNTSDRELLGEFSYDARDDIEKLYRRHDTTALAAAYAVVLRVAAFAYMTTNEESRFTRTLQRLGDCYRAHPTTDVATNLLSVMAAAVVEGRLHNSLMYPDRDQVRDLLDAVYDDWEATTDPDPDLAVALARTIAVMADEGTGKQSVDMTGILNRIDALVGTAPDRIVPLFATGLSRVVEAAIEDDRTDDAERHFDRLSELQAEYDTVEVDVDAAREALLDHCLDVGEFERARNLYARIIDADRTDTAAFAKAFRLLVYSDAVLTGDETVTQDDRYPPSGVHSAETGWLCFLLASPIVGVLGIGAFLAGTPVGLGMGSLDLSGSLAAGGVGLVLLFGVVASTSSVPPYGTFVDAGRFEFVAVPSRVVNDDDEYVFSWSDPLIGVTLLALVGLTALQSGLLVLVVIGVAIWLVATFVVFRILLWLQATNRASPSVSTRLLPETFEELGATPLEAKRHYYQRIAEVEVPD